jgi:hypothetical protein
VSGAVVFENHIQTVGGVDRPRREWRDPHKFGLTERIDQLALSFHIRKYRRGGTDLVSLDAEERPVSSKRHRVI